MKRHLRPEERFATVAAAAVLVLALAGNLAAQQADTLAAQPTTPRGAFVRALILPGRGHASICSYGRGGFYFVTETGIGIMLARTVHRLDVAKDVRDLKEARVREVLAASGVSSDSLDARVARDPTVAHTQHLVRARHNQLENWMAIGIFMFFVGGADAFVSAHLRDFPPPISLSAASGPEGSTQLGLKIAVGSHPPSSARR